MSETSDPVEYFLDDLEYHGRTDRTQVAYRRVLREFESFLTTEFNSSPQSATRRECLAWVHTLRQNTAESTVATYASYLHRFYSYMTQVGEFQENPMSLVMNELDETIDTNPTRRDISLPAMRRFVSEFTHPLERAIIVLFLKTGIRVGELCNLDLRDVRLANPESIALADTEPRAQLADRENTLFVSASPQRGEVTNGEERDASNKRQRSTLIPIDWEVESTVRRWLLIRPDSQSVAEPLFVSTGDDWGTRVTPGMVRQVVCNKAEEMGWYRSGGGAEENVTPHYFRHFFTTHLRDRTGDRGVVKYLRGDVGDDIIDTYTHNWGDRVRSVYEDHIYSVL